MYVHMVTVSIDSEDMECGVFLNCSIHDLKQYLLYCGYDELHTVFSAPDYMILKLIC